MTPIEKEKFYDENIAPELARLGRLCKDNGLPFLAICEFDVGEYGRTAYIPKHGSDFICQLNRAAHYEAPVTRSVKL